jgi:hypothetical protein
MSKAPAVCWTPVTDEMRAETMPIVSDPYVYRGFAVTAMAILEARYGVTWFEEAPSA